MLVSLRLASRLSGIYRAPRDGKFWLRDFWSALEDYERRHLLLDGTGGIHSKVYPSSICVEKNVLCIEWDS